MWGLSFLCIPESASSLFSHIHQALNSNLAQLPHFAYTKSEMEWGQIILPKLYIPVVAEPNRSPAPSFQLISTWLPWVCAVFGTGPLPRWGGVTRLVAQGLRDVHWLPQPTNRPQAVAWQRSSLLYTLSHIPRFHWLGKYLVATDYSTK